MQENGLQHSCFQECLRYEQAIFRTQLGGFLFDTYFCYCSFSDAFEIFIFEMSEIVPGSIFVELM